MEVDEHSIVMTASKDRTIGLVSTNKMNVLGNMGPHSSSVGALYWHRSLAISGDDIGEVYLWVCIV